jgi:hypothetical protein
MVTKKLGEHDIEIAVLYILKTYGDMDTAQLKQKIIQMINPQGANLDPLVNRNDTKIHQIIRNIVSHRDNPGNLIHDGYVSYDKTTRMLSITRNGEYFLDSFIIQGIIDALE